MDLKEVNAKSHELREKYHELERKYHGSEWTIEEDALAFLTDAGIIGRLTMSSEKRWSSDDEEQLPQKIGECVWWLATLSDRMGFDFESCVSLFLEEKMDELKI
ncbi:hypothetical protein [Alloscardovia omnicolens]|uniref:hypothetical protein n=1 Tax=Alloscardovia omnicolens TaxID=419015 RepID=UPI003A741E45